MFFRKITSKSNGKEYTYLKLIENYREGDKVKQRVIANLGSLDKLTPDKVNGLITGLSKICGLSQKSDKIETKKILRYGEVLAIHKIWELLGVESVLNSIIPESGNDINVPLLAELMAINQIIKPQHKQAISDWYQCLYLPELEDQNLTSHHFYRALDQITKFKEELESSIYKNINNMFQINTDLAFCLLTTSVFEPSPQEDLNLISYGKYIWREPDEFQKIDLGLLTSRDGMPLGHRIIGENAEEMEYRAILEYLRRNFGIDRCIFVGDRSILANPAMEILVAHGYEYILGRKRLANQDYDLLIGEMKAGLNGFREINEDLWFKELGNGDIRYLICCNPRASEQMKSLIYDKLNRIESQFVDLKRQISGKRGVKINNYPVLADNFCRKYIEWQHNDSTMEFSYRFKQDQILRDIALAGSFMLETNNNFLRGQEIVKAYSGLAYISESFKEIKNFEPRQNYLYAELNLSANVFMCVLAAALEKTLERIMRQAGLNLDTRKALLLLEEVKIAINQLDGEEFKSITSIAEPQEEIFSAIGIVSDHRGVI
ncbi:Transposase [Desulfotomaculum arcticum]|uniref:Transposase n=1 Tax=Desulfotruncus arcticus DSM 17038 TaxID=1121424 RepID=A0A1I2QF19_9FIRM|nr:Transposase [Desulfotomaculum arcticum] [Desulfotruncus arcticus DSM 17038]